MKRKGISRLVGIVLAATMVLSSTGMIASADEEKPVKLIIAGAQASSHPMVRGLEMINEKLEELGSSVSLDIQVDAVLGGEQELTRSVTSGIVDMAIISEVTLSTIAPDIAAVNFPGVFKDYDDVYENYYNGWAGEHVAKRMLENNARVLGFMDNGWRWVSSTKPIRTMADMEGMKIRVPDTPYLIDFFTRAKAMATPMTLSEVASALQQGVLDGQENDVKVIYSFGFAEFCKYITETGHSYSSDPIMVNEDVWQSLSEKQQQELQEAVDYACDWYMDYFPTINQENIEAMEAEGCEFIELSQEDKDLIKQIGIDMANSDAFKDVFGEELIKQMYPES